MAHQLLGKKGYAIVAECDLNGTAPGSDLLCDLFKAAGPTLVLIDEWVAYIRQTYESTGLPGGSFDSNLTFAQSLTEAAKSPRVLVVASLPQSQIEVGGEGGKKALDILQNTFTRVKSSWRPASQEESYEIVRRRLFEPISGENFAARDAVLEAFGSMYRKNEAEFPAGVKESDYMRKMEVAYPVHPELFERLYNDWASLEEFQRTRGVLRLMACSIYSLWEGNDKSLMIMPAMIPMDDQHVLSEITTKSGLSPAWTTVIEKDVDGQGSLSRKIDREITNLGRVSACRRVARTIYIGSAPISETAKKGVDDRRIKLGCVQPGESVPIFGDALRRLTDQATHLYVDGSRYWYSTQPSVTRLAQDRASQQKLDDLVAEIESRIKKEKNVKGSFQAVHDCPEASSDIADEAEARLVILGPRHPHRPKTADCECLATAKEMLEQRGNSPRLYRNTLVFLAADKTRLDELLDAVRSYLAWKSIVDEQNQLNLDNFQTRQAETKKQESDQTISSRLPETYQWLLVPIQPNPTEPASWQTVRLTGHGSLAERASKKLISEELLMPQYSGVRLRMDLDRIPLWRGNHVLVKELAENMAQYLYLPRLTSRKVLIAAIQDGLATLTWRQDTFAYAQGFDADRNRYQGLIGGVPGQVTADNSSIVVKSDVAMKQLTDEEEQNKGTNGNDEAGGGSDNDSGGSTTNGLSGKSDSNAGKLPPTQKRPKRFYGSVTLDATRLGRDAGRIATEVLSHLSGLPNADATVSLEIEIEIPDGVPENVVRTVIENCRTLKFDDQGFDN
jgi:predicted AAA+ superfamily ATPase